jgi:AraC-like DNA-binding protein
MLLEVACVRGMTSSACLSGVGLSARQLSDPTREILASQEERLIENIVAGLGDDPEIGLSAGAGYSLPTFGMFGLAILSAQTPREMITVSIGVQELSATLARARMSNSCEFGYMIIDVSDFSPSIRGFVVDHCIASIWTHAVELDGVPARAVVELTRGRPRSTRAYREMFGFEPSFGEPLDRIGFCHEYLDRTRPQVDPVALRECEERCRALIERRRATIGTAGLVRERLVRAAQAWPPMETVAADLGMSTRTLTRRLGEEATSFREIEASARRERAEVMLLRPGYSLEQVSSALGYANCSAFVRAFKRWHGAPPGHWRQHAVAETTSAQ